MSKRDGNISVRQARFVAEYLKDLNATQAAIRAGYSARSAHVIGPKQLERVEVQNAIRQAQETRIVRCEITQDRVLRELALLAFSDVTHYEVDEVSGRVTAAKDAPPGAMRAVSSIKRKIRVDKDGNIEREVELKLWDKPGPLKLAGRHVGLFPSKDDAQIKAQAKALLDEMIEQARQRRSGGAPAQPQPADGAMTVMPPAKPEDPTGGGA